ncbi:RNA polymerase sigma factor [Kitasatospora sp. NPDC088346]|uniref:RNA polymerase sigma factor n=1 Tax=Kitasatospora sp. NPDC088346 TaxID=3364073 RepID=UPI0038260E66
MTRRAHELFPHPAGRFRSTAPDPELLRAVRHGRPAAFTALVDRHWQSVRGYLGTCVADDEESDRLTGETFARAYRLARRDPPGRLPWRVQLFATARGSAVRLWRRDGAAAALTDGFRQWAAAGGAWPLNQPERLTEAYRILPAPWQTALWYAVVEQEDGELVARILGLRRRDARSLVASSLAGLRSTHVELYRRASAHRPACAPTVPSLTARAAGRPALSAASAAHLAHCPGCGDTASDLADLRGRLRRQLPVLLLGWWDGHGHRRERAAAALPAHPYAFLTQETAAPGPPASAPRARTGAAVGPSSRNTDVRASARPGLPVVQPFGHSGRRDGT